VRSALNVMVPETPTPTLPTVPLGQRACSIAVHVGISAVHAPRKRHVPIRSPPQA